MKHIVLITDTWVPQVSGVVTILQKARDLLEGRGFKVTVIHPGMFYSMPAPLYPELRLAWVTRPQMERMLLELQPDYVHIVTEVTVGLAARRACVKARIPFTSAYHTHFPLYVEAWLGFLAEPTFGYLRWFHSAAVQTIVSTHALKAELERRGFKNLLVTPFGVDTELFVPAQNQGRNPKPVFVYVGRIAREKNVEEFLKMDVTGTKLVIGDGADRARLERKYPDVRFVGYKKGKELADMLAEADVFVFPSRTDTFGLVILESLACGVPVAAHQVMGPTELITEGVDGALDEDLARAARTCVGLSKDACRKKALTHTWSAYVDSFVASLVPTK
jgi:glycosyltransferase involved in cell wall biosynthesis